MAREGHLQVCLDEPEVGRVPLEAVDADDEVKVPANGSPVLVAVVEVRHRRREPRDVATTRKNIYQNFLKKNIICISWLPSRFLMSLCSTRYDGKICQSKMYEVD